MSAAERYDPIFEGLINYARAQALDRPHEGAIGEGYWSTWYIRAVQITNKFRNLVYSRFFAILTIKINFGIFFRDLKVAQIMESGPKLWVGALLKILKIERSLKSRIQQNGL